jgi:hypothetical protein
MIETVPSNKSNRFEIIALIFIAAAAFIVYELDGFVVVAP